ncbi:hypothetical protein [Burkholderia arboris]|jgi:hypothetical protein|nr:hypothetical protein [Burkholderia arboris]
MNANLINIANAELHYCASMSAMALATLALDCKGLLTLDAPTVK